MSTTIDPETESVAPPRAALDTPSTSAPLSYLYRAVWRWHFYAGIFVIPFLLMLAITGGIYLFKPQLDALMYPQHVAPGLVLLPPTQQVHAAARAYPGSTITTFTPAPARDRSSEVGLTTSDGRALTVFVNPYTDQILGERDETNNLQYYAMTLHGELLLGTTGDRIVEIAASRGIVLMVTGLYLWWPRTGAKVWGVLLPRLRTRNRRIFWRDLHAVPGMWGALVILFLLITGLPWAGFWGGQFTRLFGDYPAVLWNDVPTSTTLTGDLNTTATKTVPWAVEPMPLPASGEHAGHGSAAPGDLAGTEQATAPVGVPAGTPVTLDAVVALAQAQGVVPGFSVSLPTDAAGVYTVSIFPDDPRQQATLHIDQYSGQILADARWADYVVAPKLVEMGIALHEGKFFGWLNQLVMLVAVLLVILLCVSAIVLWWRRRPAHTLGAPAMPAQMPLWKTAVAITVILGVVFPLMGATLIAVLLLDVLIIRRVPALKRVLG